MVVHLVRSRAEPGWWHVSLDPLVPCSFYQTLLSVDPVNDVVSPIYLPSTCWAFIVYVIFSQRLAEKNNLGSLPTGILKPVGETGHI